MNKFIFITLFVTANKCTVYSQSFKYFDEKNVATTDKMNCVYYTKEDYSKVVDFTDTAKSYYCNNNMIRSKECYSKGLKEGFSYYYYNTGKLKEKIRFIKNIPSGLTFQYFPNGKTKATLLYTKIANIKTYHPYLITNAWDSTGVQTVKNLQGYYKDETMEGKVKDGLPDSVWTTYDEVGKKIYSEKYNHGEFVEGDRLDGQGTHYTELESPTEFIGGLEALAKWLSHSMHYPRSAQMMGTEGKVFVKFIIERDGSISNAEVTKGFDGDCNREALRVISSMPKWRPGIQRGRAVRSYFTLPVVFRLNQ